MKLPLAKPPRLSHSSLSTYAECGEKWRLERLYGLRGDSWLATVAGTAVHEITEAMDRYELGLTDQDIPTFKEVFDREIELAREQGTTLNVSGKVLKAASMKGGPNKKDYAWWLEFGPVMLNNWHEWSSSTDWRIAMLPDGNPGIEVEINGPVAGRPFKGFIDRVYLTPEGQVVIVDLKSGNLPTGILQLATYAVGLGREYGLKAEWGAYWMAQSGQLSYMKDLTLLDGAWIDHQYEMAWRGIEAGVYLPNVTGDCARLCPVRDYCRAWGGRDAERVPPWQPEFYNLVGFDTPTGSSLSGVGV